MIFISFRSRLALSLPRQTSPNRPKAVAADASAQAKAGAWWALANLCDGAARLGPGGAAAALGADGERRLAEAAAAAAGSEGDKARATFPPLLRADTTLLTGRKLTSKTINSTPAYPRRSGLRGRGPWGTSRAAPRSARARPRAAPGLPPRPPPS